MNQLLVIILILSYFIVLRVSGFGTPNYLKKAGVIILIEPGNVITYIAKVMVTWLILLCQVLPYEASEIVDGVTISGDVM